MHRQPSHSVEQTGARGYGCLLPPLLGIGVARFNLRQGQSRIPSEIAEWLSRAGDRNALLLDGAEQLSTLSWLGLRFRTRRLGAFVITAHREGLLPTALRCETSPGLLLELLDELAPDRPRSFPSAESLWDRHGGDLRQAMFEAYDIALLKDHMRLGRL